MPKQQSISVLGEWEGYEVAKTVRVESRSGQPKVWIELRPVAGALHKCSACGSVTDRVHDLEKRFVRDLHLFDAVTWLVVYRVRVACPQCGPKVEELPWLDRYSRVTKRLAESVARLCRILPIKHVAAFFSLGWDAVKAVDKAALLESVGPVDLRGVRVIAMDEFAIQKGHRYATVVVQPETKRVLWVGRGRGREDVRPFFELLGEAGRREIQAVVMDMNGAYEEEVRQQCPKAEVVFDLFHVVAKFGREVIDRVRVDEANRLRGQPKARRVIKSARWLLLRNRENIDSRKDKIRLDELLAANRKLMTVYVLKDDLKHLWDYRRQAVAMGFWRQWYNRAVRSRIEPLKQFAMKLKRYLPGILAHCRWPLHTSVLEGINNKIKVIKRMAYGFRDDEYFFLKIRAAFPGTTG